MTDTAKKMSLKALRNNKDMTQQELATKLNIHVNTYRGYELEPAHIRIGTLIRICDILGCKITDVDFYRGE